MKGSKGFTLKKLIVLLIAIAVLGILIAPKAEAVEEDQYTVGLTYMCCSKHTSEADNEQHNGVGLSLSLPESDSMFGGATLGVMGYNNSHNQDSIMLYVSKEFWDIAEQVHIGVGAGIASGYQDEMAIPAAAWVHARYKWIVITHIPLTVTTIGLHIPLAAFK